MKRADDDLHRWILDALAAEDLHSSYAGLLRNYVDDVRDQWRVCCGSDCDPCMMHLGRAVDRVRAQLAGGSDGSSRTV